MLSDTRLRNISGKPYKGTPELSDRDGLSVRISPTGVISWQYRFRYRGKSARLKLGRYPDLSVKDARALIPELRHTVESGDDPRIKWSMRKTDQVITVASCVDEFISKRLLNLKQKTVTTYSGMLNKHYRTAFKGRSVDSITHTEWLDWFDKKAAQSPKLAAGLLTIGKTVFRWCGRRKLVSNPPILDIYTADVGVKPTTGNRVLTIRECRLVWAALDKTHCYPSVTHAIRLCMMFGCRQSEILNARREHFDFQEMIWTVPEDLSKTGKPIRRPITPEHKNLIRELWDIYGEDGLLLPSRIKPSQPPSSTALIKAVAKVIQIVDMPNWRIHDFRRTLSTRLSELGVMPHVTEKMLGHSLTGVMAVYNKHDWLEDQREAYELWCKKVIPSPL